MKVLVVDDDDIFQEKLRFSLEKRGCDVVTADNGLEAWRIFEREPIQILISDWMMPHLDGLSLCQKVRQKMGAPYAYFILLTVRTSTENYHEAMQAGVDDFLTKPLRQDELFMRLHVAERIVNLHGYQDRLHDLASKLLLSEEEERHRIAVGLHDSIGQTLATCKLKFDILQSTLKGSLYDNSTSEIKQMIEEMIHEVRTLTFDLSPPILYEVGLEAGIHWLIDKKSAQYGLVIHYQNHAELCSLDENMKILLFRMIRELLVNIAKHAKAKKVKISTRQEDQRLEIEISDDGIGFDTQILSDVRAKSGFGLFSIRERLKHFGGGLKVQSFPCSGTQILIKVPFPL